MGFLDSMPELLDRGVTAARGAMATVGGENLGFMRGFSNMCARAYDLGFHEHNGGNASYRLTDADINALRSMFYDTYGNWVPLAVSDQSMANEYLLVTGSGKQLGNVAESPSTNVGVIKLDASGAAWRLMWGLSDGGMPTSELDAHVLAHGVRKRLTGGLERVVYHAHPTNLGALPAGLPASGRELTRALWKTYSESVIAFPNGIGYTGWMCPGSLELAQATAGQLEMFNACMWQLHGVLVSAADFDSALGMVHAMEKAAQIYMAARAAVADKSQVAMLSDDCLRVMARRYDLPINESFLD